MQVSVEATGAIARRMTVALPADRFSSEYAARIQRLGRSARMPGFRPGKAPLKLVEAQYGGRVTEEVLGELVRASFQEAVSQQGLRIAGDPVFESPSVAPGQDIRYTATFEVYPQVARLDIAGSSIERPAASVSDADVERTVQSLRKQRRTWRTVDRAAATGDLVTVDYSAAQDGKPVSGLAEQDYAIEIGSGAMLPEFENGLIGARAGETRNLGHVLPGEAANTTVNITVKSVQEAILPDLDAGFAHALGVAEGGIERLRADVRTNLEREMQERIRVRVRDQVFDALVSVNGIEAPTMLVDEEARRVMLATREMLVSQGVPAARLPNDWSAFQRSAQRRVVLGIIVGELVRARGIRPDAARVRARVETLAQGYESPQEYIDWHFAEAGRLKDLEAQVLEDQVVEALLETAQVTDKAMSFEELTRPAAPDSQTPQSGASS